MYFLISLVQRSACTTAVGISNAHVLVNVHVESNVMTTLCTDILAQPLVLRAHAS